ncbi:PfkB family carbohydrate kinase [Tateyamaria pelophila]|uniref:PfkB family carbohydrate kinase n=1 Tax=Tateyamaria pelophila TaxID=328415 RepID=UPI001CBD6876|nr:PfkB family carbohydrate kinase [Tateyamaria pelophila]
MTLLVVGSLHLDVVVRAPHLPALDETVTGSAVDYVFGGKGGNQALAAARMGAQVSFAGRAGSDRFGDMIRDALRAENVDMSQLQTDIGPSGMSVAVVDAQGDYGAVIVSAANLQIEGSQLDVPEGTKLVLLQNEIPEMINISIAAKARAAGAQVWLNAAPARALSDELMQSVDLLIVNRVEDAFYADVSGPERLTTLGAEGVQHAGQTHPGFAVDVISTHGAGDVFVGALAAQVVGGTPLTDAIAFAQAAAALHVSSTLEKRLRLTPENVRAFLKAQPSR